MELEEIYVRSGHSYLVEFEEQLWFAMSCGTSFCHFLTSVLAQSIRDHGVSLSITLLSCEARLCSSCDPLIADLMINVDLFSRVTMGGGKPRRHPRTENLENGEAGQYGRESSNAQIAVVVPGSSCVAIVRYMPYDPDPRVKFQSELARLHSPDSPYLTVNEECDIRMTPIWKGRGAFKKTHERDVIDYIFAMFYVPGQDPWTRHLRKTGQDQTKEKHILEFIDDCVRNFDNMGYGDTEL